MTKQTALILPLVLICAISFHPLVAQIKHRQNTWNWAGFTAPDITVPQVWENEPLVIIEAAFTLQPLKNQVQGYLRLKFQQEDGILRGNAFTFPYNPDPLYFNLLTPDFLPPVFAGEGLSLLAGRNLSSFTPTPLMFLEKKVHPQGVRGYLHQVAIRELEAPAEVELVFQHPMFMHPRWLLLFPWPCIKAEMVVEWPGDLSPFVVPISPVKQTFRIDQQHHFVWENLPAHSSILPLTRPEKIPGIQWIQPSHQWFALFGDAVRARPQPASLLYGTPTDAYHAKLNEVGRQHGFLSPDTPLIQKLRAVHSFLQKLHYKPDSLEKKSRSLDQSKYYVRKDTLREKDVLKVTEDLLYRIPANHYLLFTRPNWMAGAPIKGSKEIFALSALLVCDGKDSLIFWPRWNNLSRPVHEIPYYLEGAWALLVPRSLDWPEYHQRETQAKFQWIRLPVNSEPPVAKLNIHLFKTPQGAWTGEVRGEGIWKNWHPFSDPWLWSPPVLPGFYSDAEMRAWPWNPGPENTPLPVRYQETWIISGLPADMPPSLEDCGCKSLQTNRSGNWEFVFEEKENSGNEADREIRRCVLRGLKQMLGIRS